MRYALRNWVVTADVDSLTKDGNTALHLAVKERRRHCMKLLIANGARTDICSASSGETLLHVAARLGDEQTVRLLLQKGANKDVKNFHGKTVYDVAVEYGHARLFDLLKLGDRLCTAARNGEERAIQRLLENGAVINGRDQHGWTALHRAVFKGHVDAVRMLLDKGVNLDAKDEDGYMALHCATESGHADVVEVLVKKGDDVEVRTNQGVTAVQIAESLHYAGITRLLVDGGANKEDGTGMGQQRALYGTISKDTDKKNKTSIKHGRTRSSAMRSSFNRSLPLAVV